MSKRKGSIPPFINFKPTRSKQYSRVDSVNLAKDSDVLDIVLCDWEDEPIINAQDWLKDKK